MTDNPYSNPGPQRPMVPQQPMGMPGQPMGAPQQPMPLPQQPPVSAPVGHQGTRVSIQEKMAWSMNGGAALILLIVLLVAAGWFFLQGWSAFAEDESFGGLAIGAGIFLIFLIFASAFTIINPGDTKVLQFFGAYVGTVRRTGLVMTIPWTSKKTVSVKVRNFETHELKVNDADGNPVNIAAIVVWQVADTARSTFAVENYYQFVAVQAEAALRHVATTHPYDNGEAGEETLRGSTDLVARELAHEVAERISIAGLEVVETRISSLAYAPEIAQAMLQRQQAAAVIAARSKIVEGAVSMVESALTQLEHRNVATFSEDHKATMVSNLLVVLCSDTRAQPVVNAGN